MSEIIAACGLACHTCPAYQATQANDAAKVAEVAAAWSREYKADIKPEHVWCDGCMSAGERKCAHAGECAIRACALDRKLANCGLCDDYACDKVRGLLDAVPAARATLDDIRAGR